MHPHCRARIRPTEPDRVCQHKPPIGPSAWSTVLSCRALHRPASEWVEAAWAAARMRARRAVVAANLSDLNAAGTLPVRHRPPLPQLRRSAPFCNSYNPLSISTSPCRGIWRTYECEPQTRRVRTGVAMFACKHQLPARKSTQTGLQSLQHPATQRKC